MPKVVVLPGPHAAIGTGISSQNAQAMVAAQMNRMSFPVKNQIKRTGSPFSVNANGGVRSPAGAGGEHRGGNIEGGSGMVHSVSRAEELVDLASEQNWRLQVECVEALLAGLITLLLTS